MLNKLFKFEKGATLNLSTFFFLYIAQSIPMSFFSTAIQVIMREAEFSYSSIALMQIVKLPWVLKFIWAPLIDRNCISLKDYKRAIISSEVVYALLLIVVGLLNVADDFFLIISLIILSLIASATQDIATDSLAVLSFKNKDKNMVNSMQSMGSFGGVIIGSGVLLMVLNKYGWNAVVHCLAGFVLIALLPLLFNRKLQIEQKQVKQRAKFTDFIWFFNQRKIWKQIGFLMLYYASTIGLLSVLRPYLVDLGYSKSEIGVLFGVVGSAAAFVSSFCSGLIVRRIGIYSARIIFAIFALITALYFWAISWTPTTVLITLGIILLWVGYGMSTIVVYTSSMNSVREGREGTDFTVQTVLTHFSGIIIALLSGKVADNMGVHSMFGFEVILAVISLIYILLIFKKEKSNG
ncbi:MAG: MFS transporter [Rikenellaceae bacterium]